MTLSFVQKSAHMQKRSKASAVLRVAAQKSGDTSLVLLANKAAIDAFGKVISAIDEMTTSLKKEMDDEVKHQRFCSKELTENEAGQEEKKDHIEDLTAQMEDNTATVDTLTKEIAELQKQVAEMKVQVKRASEDREKANKIFQQAVADQRATQNILNKVYKRLAKVYSAKPAAASCLWCRRSSPRRSPWRRRRSLRSSLRKRTTPYSLPTAPSRSTPTTEAFPPRRRQRHVWRATS